MTDFLGDAEFQHEHTLPGELHDPDELTIEDLTKGVETFVEIPPHPDLNLEDVYIPIAEEPIVPQMMAAYSKGWRYILYVGMVHTIEHSGEEYLMKPICEPKDILS